MFNYHAKLFNLLILREQNTKATTGTVLKSLITFFCQNEGTEPSSESSGPTWAIESVPVSAGQEGNEGERIGRWREKGGGGGRRGDWGRRGKGKLLSCTSGISVPGWGLLLFVSWHRPPGAM